MSKHQDKLERTSPATPEIANSGGALDDQDLEKVTGGDKASPKEFPKETVSFAYAAVAVKYSE
jgi:hypothetical protein